jgi:hypothetical protein
VAQLSEPGRIRLMSEAVPARYDVPNQTPLPTIACLDFAAVRGSDGRYVPQLVELQGFPSLLAFETMQRDAWEVSLRDVAGLDRPWSAWFAGLDRASFLALARDTIVGDHEPAHVALVDLDPPAQKTQVDFAATKVLFDVDAVCPTQLEKRGRRLFRRDADGRELPVERIYHRLVIDELERSGLTLPFDLRDDLDVEWSPHPNWFWIWSKYSLPFLTHPAVPETRLLSEIATLPADLARDYVLKPLFSFAGAGVNVHPEPRDVAAIARNERARWCLQRKIAYGPAIEAVDGGSVKLEIRVMLLRPDDATEFVPATNLCRLSRGDMHGVDQNKDKTWVGSSIGMWPA